MTNLLAVLVLSAATAAVVTVAAAEPATQPAAPATQPTTRPINAMCPVMPDDEVDGDYTLVYEGRVIGFCCEDCVDKFRANPQRYLPRLPK
jgi:YHS domain-containing protein